jgi:DNA-binding winged helix-turn-helix (wHTH) protein/TolB-like protein
MSNSVKHFYEFGPFSIDVKNRLLLRDGEPLPLTPKVVDTLLVLVQHGGQVVRKDDLMQLVWPDTVVEEGNLTQNIYLLRKTLCAGSDRRNYIETVPRRGYRFVGAVRESEEGHEERRGDEEGRRDAEKRGRGETTSDFSSTRLSVAASSQSSVAASPPPRVAASRPSASHTLPVMALLVMLTGLSYLMLSSKPKSPETKPTPAIQSIAVLPFKPLASADGDADLGREMADALITQLSNVRQIAVRPTSSVLKYDGSTQDLMTAGRELNVDALLDGKFQRADGRLRVTVQLISVRDGTPLWADKFDVQLTDMLAAQDAVAQRVTQELALKLSSEEQRLLTKRFAENPDAYQAYLKGRYYWSQRATPALEEGIKYFEQALHYDPDYALAYAGLAGAYATLGSRYDAEGESVGDAFPKAKAAATRALKLNELLAEAHTALAVVKARYDWDFDGAESAFKRAIELNPNYAHAHHVYALYLSATGRAVEAQAEMKRAQELDPLSFSISRGLGDILLRARQYDQALEQYRRTLATFPGDPKASLLHRTMGWAYEYHGMHRQALAEFIESQRLQNIKAEWLTALQEAYDRAGMKGYWRKWLELQEERIAHGRVNPFHLAQVYAFLGEKDQAFAYLQKACEDRSVPLPALRFGPHFDYLRTDPRYATLMQRIGLTS